MRTKEKIRGCRIVYPEKKNPEMICMKKQMILILAVCLLGGLILLPATGETAEMGETIKACMTDQEDGTFRLEWEYLYNGFDAYQMSLVYNEENGTLTLEGWKQPDRIRFAYRLAMIPEEGEETVWQYLVDDYPEKTAAIDPKTIDPTRELDLGGIGGLAHGEICRGMLQSAMEILKETAGLTPVDLGYAIYEGENGSEPAEGASRPAATAKIPEEDPSGTSKKKTETTPLPAEMSPDQVTVLGGIYQLDDGKKAATFMRAEDPEASTLMIPDSIDTDGISRKVKTIAKDACKGMKNLTFVSIGANVRKIGKNAFSGCEALRTIAVNTEKLTDKSVGEKAFRGVSETVTVRCPAGKKEDYSVLLKTKGLPETAKVTE
jgi:hypothetical protein